MYCYYVSALLEGGAEHCEFGRNGDISSVAYGHTQTGKSPLLKDLIFKHRVEVEFCLIFLNL